jgi:soluble lytic murein transglycosylase-like protein
MVRARRSRLALVAGALLAAVAVAFALRGSHAPSPAVPTVPAPHGVKGAFKDPYAWAPQRSADFSARAAAGTAPLLYELSPGGAAASAQRVLRYRPLIERAAKAAGVSPDRLEGLVFLESAGRPDALTAGGIEGAAGLTQILAETGRDLLGMHVDTARSGAYTRRIARAVARGELRHAAALSRARRRVDDRFDPGKALAATARYLTLAKRRFGREDLAFVSYHMGIGNLQGVLGAYGRGNVPYAQLYFDSTPTHHAAAYRRLAGFGDDSSNYFWKIGAAEQIMRLARAHRTPAFAPALPPADGPVRPFPNRPGLTGLVAPAGARIRQDALALALYVGAQVRAIGGAPSLRVTGAGGSTFSVARDYASHAQALAFQFELDRLTVLHVITWNRVGREIDVSVSRDAALLDGLLGRLG